MAYSAPEALAEEGTAEQAADVYSYGICMWQLAAGKRPYQDLAYSESGGAGQGRAEQESRPTGECGEGALLVASVSHASAVPTSSLSTSPALAALSLLAPRRPDPVRRAVPGDAPRMAHGSVYGAAAAVRQVLQRRPRGPPHI